MTGLRTLLDEYLATRRALGAALAEPELLLKSFLGFLEQQETAFVATPLALEWATKPQGVQPAHWAKRLAAVRAFARYASAADPRHEVPPEGLLPARPQRATPYLYSDEEIAGLLDAARRLPSRTGLRPCTYATLLALLAVTGMRSSEPVRLERGDVDLGDGILTVRNSKFGKSRLIPVHESTNRALAAYAGERDRLCPRPLDPAFFLSERGTRITQHTLQQTFVQLSRQVGLRSPSDSFGPRLHDLRHRFAVSTLLRWHRDGLDVEQRLPHLATYLGHAHVSDTYWYLTATPELLQCAARRLDRTARRLPA
ncbi:MAG: tyrosine-type recombinase/integrase [Caldilineaceae bacterium]|nr:tyrosine-type recombinase/integrase [Caldilineaceae bacterium]